jgi:AraC-like DNA-binding protein
LTRARHSDEKRRVASGISKAVVAPVVRALAELGYAVDLARLAAPEVVEGGAADALIDDAARFLSDDAIGLSLAKRVPIGSLGDVDYVLCMSRTLREGLARAARFYQIATERVKLTLLEGGPETATLLFDRDTSAPYSRHWSEFGTALIGERIRQTIGRSVAFTEVSFAHGPPPSGTRVHDEHFGTKVLFGAPSDRLSFAATLLETPLLTASAALAEVLEARMREVAKTATESDSYVERVRAAVAELLDGGETLLPATAARLGTSTRTLQRELKQRGVSHQTILDEVRRDHAKALLERGVAINDVARQLGFSESSAFFRAFRRWTGTSPRGKG